MWNFQGAADLSPLYSRQSVLPDGGILPFIGGVLELRDWWAEEDARPPMWVPVIAGALIWFRDDVMVVTAWGIGGGK